MRFDFLICSERSGSNLITKLLDSHPEVCGPFPSHMVRTFSLNLNGYGDLNDDAAWSTLLDDAVFYINRIISLWKSDFRLESEQYPSLQLCRASRLSPEGSSNG